MISTAFLAVLLLAPQQSDPPVQKAYPPIISPEKLKEVHKKAEASRQAAIRINEFAGNIHSEQDARAFVDAVAEEFYGHHHLGWIGRDIRHRVAHAEYEAVSDPARLIPEQRVVDVWNEYVRELDAPAETLITVAEVHNLRDAMYASKDRMWTKLHYQSMWTIPNVYPGGADGRVADGCRAVEALKILHDLFFSFPSVRMARDRVQKGVLVSDLIKQPPQDTLPQPQAVRAEFKTMMSVNPVQPAESRYIQAHGERDYDRLIRRLFDELFPRE